MKINKKGTSLYLETDSGEYLISKELIYKYKLDIKPTPELTIEIVKDIIIEAGYNEALKLLKDPKTEFEVREKLRVKYNQEIISLIIEKLKHYHFLDDLLYVKNYISYQLPTHGKNYILLKLRQKGIKEDIIKPQLDNVNEAEILIKKIPLKLRQQKGSIRMISLKVINYFTQRGYDFELVEEILNMELAKLDLNDEEALKKEIKNLAVRFQGYQDDFLKKQKFIKVLQEKGFGYELILKYLNPSD